MSSPSDSVSPQPHRRRLMRIGKAFGATAVLGLAAAGISYASIPDSGGVIHGCYNKTSYALRVIDTAKTGTCPLKTTSLNWSQGTQGTSTSSTTNVSLAHGNTLVPVMTAPTVTTSGTYFVNASIMLTVGAGDGVACVPVVNGGEAGIFGTVADVPNQSYQTVAISVPLHLNAGDTLGIDCSGYNSVAQTSFYDGGLTATLINTSAPAGTSNQPAANLGKSLPPLLH